MPSLSKSIECNTPRNSKRTKVCKIATINVRTLKDPSDLTRAQLTCLELDRYGMKVCGLCETRWPGFGMIRVSEDWSIIFSGKDGSHHSSGVGLAIHKSFQPFLEDYSPISDRILSATFQLPEGKLTLFQVYAPTEQALEEDVANFYDRLHDEVSKVKSSEKDMLVVMGDFNAQIGNGCHAPLYPEVLGKHGSSNKISKNGEHLLHFCSVHRLQVTNTLFQHKHIHKVTWYSPDNRTQNMIDYILVNSSGCNKVMNTRVFRGAVIDSDHKLVCSVLHLDVKKQHHKPDSRSHRPLYDEGKLKYNRQRGQFQLELKNTFEALSEDVETPEIEWENVRKGFIKAACSTLGSPPKKKCPKWLSERTLQWSKAKREAHGALLDKPQDPIRKQKYRQARNQTNKSARRDKERLWRRRGRKMNGLMKTNNLHEFYKELRYMIKGPGDKRTAGKLKDVHGNVIQNREAKLEVWKQHYSLVFHVGKPVDVATLDSLPHVHSSSQSTNTDNTRSTTALGGGDSPTISEVCKAIRTLKRHRAPGLDGITAELLIGGGKQSALWMHRLISSVWQSGCAPHDWKRACMINLHKQGDTSVCDNFRGISLNSIPGKVHAIILRNHLLQCLEPKFLEYQNGFRQGRSCADSIFVARQLINMSHEYEQRLYACFIDLTKAYDSINREALWRVLEQYEVPEKVLNLIKDLHEGSEACVRDYGATSGWFSIGNGVKQGCVLAPLLFNVFIDFIIKQTLAELPGDIGVEIEYSMDGRLERLKRDVVHDSHVHIPIMMYADDMKLICTNARHLHDFILKLEDVTQKWGLTINVSKTKIMHIQSSNWSAPDEHWNGEDWEDYDTFSSVDHTTPVILRAEEIEVVEEFKYLGSMLSSEGDLSCEISYRISSALKRFACLTKPLWKNRYISTDTKLKVYKAVVLPSLLYGSESWAILDSQLKKLEVFHMKCLRQIMGITVRDRVPNTDILRFCKVQSISELIRKSRLRWLGHIGRMNDVRLPKKVLFSKLVNGTRCQGRTRRTWQGCVRNDFKELSIGYKAQSWFRHCQNRSYWRRHFVQGV